MTDTPAAPIAAAPVPAVSGAPAAPVAAPADNGLSGEEAGFLALIAAAGLAGIGLLAMRSRRKARDESGPLEVAPPAQVVPVAAAVPAPAAPQPAASPERFAMPAGPVSSGADREALLKRMVAAPPDAANPFVSRKRRVHRARILLAERERELRDRSTEPFDWRTYSPTGANAPRPVETLADTRGDPAPEIAHNPT